MSLVPEGLGVALGVALGETHGAAVGLGVPEGEAEAVPAPDGAGATDAAGLEAAGELLTSVSRRNGFRRLIELGLGVCKKLIELIATDPKFGLGSIT